MSIPFQNTYSQLPARFFASQTPASVPAPKLIRANPSLAADLSIDPTWLASDEALATFSGNVIAPGSEPIAQAYAGHQFAHFVPQLGDGRAILLGEVLDKNGKRFDIQLKGSGRTAFSRSGDGKSALGPVIREYIVSEAMAALGVPTTRALAAVVSGETVYRQEGEVAGGIFTRVASSHIRVGTFQYFLARNDIEALRTLADYVIARHYSQAAERPEPYLALLDSVVAAQADLVAHWMSLGFIHGVMNTDNCAVSGETIDYGPCAFMDAFHPQCVFSSIDSRGRYAWGNQGNIAFWNLTRFAETLLPLIDPDETKAQAKAESSLDLFPDRFGDQYTARFRAKLALSPESPVDLIKDCLELLATQQVDFTLFFRHLTRVAAGDDSSTLANLFSDSNPFEIWFANWRLHADPDTNFAKMQAANPILIPRNHRVEQAIQAAYRSDFAPFHRLVEALANPYTEQTEFADLEAPPLPAEIVHQTFCGT